VPINIVENNLGSILNAVRQPAASRFKKATGFGRCLSIKAFSSAPSTATRGKTSRNPGS
jgi:hypothetical protein